MKLRLRLALHYGAVVAIALLTFGGLTYHEHWTEEKLRDALPPAHKSEASRGDETEALVYSLIPVIVIAGWWLTRRSLRPLEVLAQSVEETTVASLDQPIERTGNGDEVDRLAKAFNTMASRVHGSFQQVREFTLHASHELKTPLTVMRGEVEEALGDAGCSTEHRERLHALAGEIERLTKIVDGLTLLTKADAGQAELQLRPVAMGEIVREAFEDAEILAEPHRVSVRLGACDDITVLGSRDRLRQLLLNLVNNAVKYNEEGGTVAIALRRAGAFAEIEIANGGHGVSEELLPVIFNRFVRGAEARHRAIEGCGLGLSIAQWVAHAHGGTIEMTSRHGLTIVTVRLPLLRG